MEKYEPNELFVYTKGSRWELGQVKSECVDGKAYFCWYTRGDTAARTPVEHMHKLENAGWAHVDERMEQLEQLCRDMISDFGQYAVSDQNYQLATMCDDYQQRMKDLGLLEGEEQ